MVIYHERVNPGDAEETNCHMWIRKDNGTCQPLQDLLLRPQVGICNGRRQRLCMGRPYDHLSCVLARIACFHRAVIVKRVLSSLHPHVAGEGHGVQAQVPNTQ